MLPTKHCTTLLLLFISLVQLSHGLQNELSIVIEAGKRECFHQFLVNDLSVETDYQVISGGDLDVSYWISTPSNRVIFTELRKQGGQTQFKTEEKGEYRFCFDNSFSRFQPKQVFFFITTNDNFIDPFFPLIQEEQLNVALPKDVLGIELEGKLESIDQLFQRVQMNLEKAQRVQHMFRGFELIDRNLMEESFERVNFWSVVNVFIMMVVAVIQVYMIKSLFEDKSKVGKMLRS